MLIFAIYETVCRQTLTWFKALHEWVFDYFRPHRFHLATGIFRLLPNLNQLRLKTIRFELGMHQYVLTIVLIIFKLYYFDSAVIENGSISIYWIIKFPTLFYHFRDILLNNKTLKPPPREQWVFCVPFRIHSSIPHNPSYSSTLRKKLVAPVAQPQLTAPEGQLRFLRFFLLHSFLSICGFDRQALRVWPKRRGTCSG